MTELKAPGATVSGTQTIQRAAAILRLLAANNRQGLRLADLHRSAGLERSTAHRILQGLIAEQLAAQHPVSRRYFLGSSLYEMGLAAAPRFQLRDLCHPHLKTLAEQSGDTVFLAIRSGFNGVCVDRIEGSFPIRVFVMEVGRPRPLNIGGCNAAILSTLPDAEIERICRVNQDTIAASYPNYSEAALWRKVRETRSRGYLINEVIETPSARSIAAPIRGSFAAPALAGVSISALAARIQPPRTAELARLLLDTIARIEADIAAIQD